MDKHDIYVDSCKMASVAERYLDDKCPFRFKKNFSRSSNQGSIFSSSGFANASKALKEWYPKVGEIQVKRNFFDFAYLQFDIRKKIDNQNAIQHFC